MADVLQGSGCSAVNTPEAADLILLNTGHREKVRVHPPAAPRRQAGRPRSGARCRCCCCVARPSADRCARGSICCWTAIPSAPAGADLAEAQACCRVVETVRRQEFDSLDTLVRHSGESRESTFAGAACGEIDGTGSPGRRTRSAFTVQGKVARVPDLLRRNRARVAPRTCWSRRSSPRPGAWPIRCSRTDAAPGQNVTLAPARP